jgi:adenylate cyclase
MSAVVVERSIDCACERQALWCMVADTERLNRAIGLGSIALAPNESEESSARFVVSTVSGGFAMEYEEHPFEWVENERFTVRRVLRGGMFHEIVTSFSLAPRDGGGTRLSVRIEVDPKIGFMKPIVRFQVARSIARIEKEVREIDAQIGQGRPPGFQLSDSRVHHETLDRIGRELATSAPEADRDMIARLVDFVRSGPDPDVMRVRPFELAERWQADGNAVLRACLHAALGGLFELRWDLVCPSCRTASSQLTSLSELGKHGDCQLCDITFDLDLDRAVEVTFRPTRAVRHVDEGPYCVGGPMRMPHIVAQSLIAPDAEVKFRTPDKPGRLRLFARGGATLAIEAQPGSPASANVVLTNDNFSQPGVQIAPGGEIHVKQAQGQARHVKLERLEYASRAATAHSVSLMPEFRRHFASEILRPGLSLQVARVALLFTDLTNSTQLYNTIGDASAFSIVQDHFVLLDAIIAKHEGVVVKTIGDAVMAAFPDEAQAIRAAVEMHAAFDKFRDDHDHAKTTRLKIGMHAGPCYAVTANGILDYFGQTVNIAARLQGEAKPGELVLSAKTAAIAKEKSWLGNAKEGEHFVATLKGVGSFEAARFAVDV